jgi:hypothetical protein
VKVPEVRVPHKRQVIVPEVDEVDRETGVFVEFLKCDWIIRATLSVISHVYLEFLVRRLSSCVGLVFGKDLRVIFG